MKFNIDQIDQMEADLRKAVHGAQIFADRATYQRLQDLTGLMAEVRHFVHTLEYGGGTTAAQERWLKLFTEEE